MSSDIDGLCTGYFVDLAGASQFASLSLESRLVPGESTSGELSGSYDSVYETGCRGRVIFHLVFDPPAKRPFPVIPVPGLKPPASVIFQSSCPFCDTRLVVRAEKL